MLQVINSNFRTGHQDPKGEKLEAPEPKKIIPLAANSPSPKQKAIKKTGRLIDLLAIKTQDKKCLEVSHNLGFGKFH